RHGRIGWFRWAPQSPEADFEPIHWGEPIPGDLDDAPPGLTVLPGVSDRPHLTPDGRTLLLRGPKDSAVLSWDLRAERPAGARLAPGWKGLMAASPGGARVVGGSEVWRLARPLSLPAAPPERPAPDRRARHVTRVRACAGRERPLLALYQRTVT